MHPIFQAGHDDLLEVATADQIIHHRWLGPWTNLVLAKGPGYPLFLAIVHPFGVSPAIATQVVYLAGACSLAFGTWLWLGRTWLAVVLFSALALNPVMFGSEASRVYREGWTAALAVTALGFSVLLSYVVAHRKRTGLWAVRYVATLVPVAVGLAWLSATRSDSMLWLVPSLAMFAGTSIFLVSSTWRERMVRTCLWFAAGIACAAAFIGIQHATLVLNREHYGAAVVDDFSKGEFARASNVWASVLAGSPRQYVSVTRDQRLAVYSVSPTARELEPYLETPDNMGWKAASCARTDICDESGAWFPWQLRDAAIQAEPSIKNEAEFQAFFRRLSTEIQSGCRDGRLKCGEPGLAPGLAPLGTLNKTLIAANSFAWVKNQLSFSAAARPNQIATPAADPAVLALWKQTVNGMDDGDSAGGPVEEASALMLEWLTATYSTMAWILVIPALIGLLWGAVAGKGRDRVASAIGVSAGLGACIYDVALGVYFAGSVPMVPNGGYSIVSQGFLLVGLVLGGWLFVSFARSLMRRHRVRAKAGQLDSASKPSPAVTH